MQEIEAHPLWSMTSEDNRNALIYKHRMGAPLVPDLSTDEKLQAALKFRPFALLDEMTQGVPARVARLLVDLAQLHEPKVQFIRVDRPLLRNADDVDAWIGSQRQALLKAIGQGPVQVE
jgi:hypothetical protein